MRYRFTTARFQRQLTGRRVRRTGGPILANAAAERHQAKHESGCALYEFEEAGAMYWFHLASSKGLPQEDRTIVGGRLPHGRPSPRCLLPARLPDGS